jgi:hypothetical protein
LGALYVEEGSPSGRGGGKQKSLKKINEFPYTTVPALVKSSIRIRKQVHVFFSDLSKSY